MFFKKKDATDLIEQPLGYWEESSYMLVVPEQITEDLIPKIFERVANIDGVQIKEKSELKEKEPGKIKLIYENEEYDVGFYPSDFSLPEMYINKNYHFSDEEIEKLRDAKSALTIFMKFNENAKKSYHLQLKLAVAMIPNMIGIMDESAEKIIPSSWAKMAAESHITPGPNDLFTVQAVSDKNGEVWLHTHGLCRCGTTELEILQSDNKNYNNHYNIITTLASDFIDRKKEPGKSAYIGVLSNGQPIVVTCMSWTKGLSQYKKLDLGSIKDRQDGHNSRTSIIFMYKSEEDEKNGKITKVSEFNNLWGDNPIFFISNEETARMKALAMERFDFVKQESNKKENKIIIKIGLPMDGEDNFEHIWFELRKIEEEKFKAVLLQEPYNVKNMHEGDEGWYTVQDVTDWVIYTPNSAINPGKAYLLIK